MGETTVRPMTLPCMIMKPDEGSYPKGHGQNIAKTIEQYTSRLPPDTFLWASLGSIAFAIGLHAAGHREKANFVAHWAPTFLLLGVYNEIMKYGSETVNVND